MARFGSILVVLCLSSLSSVACSKPGPTPEEIEAQRKDDLATAEARLRNGLIEDAGRYYELVLAQTPSDPEALAGLGKVRYRQNRYEDAERLLTQSLAQAPRAQTHATLGDLYNSQKRHADAAEAYGKAFAAEDDNSEYGLAYGRALNASEQFAKAEEVLESVAELDPQAITHDKIGVYTFLGDAKRAQGKLDDALRTYMKAQTTYGSDKMAYAGAAFAYEGKQDIKHAIDQWSAYIQRDCCSDYSRSVAQKKIMELSPEG